MSDSEQPDLEDESRASREARRRKWIRLTAEEFALVSLFLAAFFTADYFSNLKEPATALAVIGIAFVVAVLGFWLMLHVRRLKALDEFERVVEMQALALAGGCAVLFSASWGAAEIVLGAPDFPLIMIAPLYSVLYSLARLRIATAFK